MMVGILVSIQSYCSLRTSKLGAKLDALTRQWDIYAKEGVNDYAKVNPQNFRPVFTKDQLSISLRASVLISAVMRGSLNMDVKQLHKDIRAAYAADPITSAQLPTPSAPKWTFTDGLLYLNNRIYVPDVPGLRLWVTV